jgi:hypothetical protein
MGQAHAAMAGLMLEAGLVPKLQFGEILWWFEANSSGMAFKAAGQSALGRALATFNTPNDDPSVNIYADANFLRDAPVQLRRSNPELRALAGPICLIRVAVADGRKRSGQLQAAVVHQPALPMYGSLTTWQFSLIWFR